MSELQHIPNCEVHSDGMPFDKVQDHWEVLS